MSKVGGLIRYFRKQKRISQQELAEVLGVTQAFIHKVEVGKSKFPNSRISDVCKFLGVKEINFLEAQTEDFCDEVEQNI